MLLNPLTFSNLATLSNLSSNPVLWDITNILASLITYRIIFKNSVNTKLLIMDEVFDSSLDGFGTEEFLKIIRYVIKDANIFVISHKTGLEDKFESVARFEKVKGFSRMVD